jgi:poly(beta-D-mannuronate) lyase
MPQKIIKILFLILISSTSITFATNYYVKSPSEITFVMNIAQPGDTLIMANDVWTDDRIVFKGDGADGTPIVLRAEMPGYVILNGTSNLRISGSYLVVDGLRFVNGYSASGGVIEFRSGLSAHHCRMTNCAIVDYNPSSKNTDYKWVSLYGTHNRVDHCYFTGKNHAGTTLVVWFPEHPHYHLIDHNYFGYRPPLGENAGETIRVGTSDWSMEDSYTTVEYNYFERCNGEIEIISSKSCENIYRYNTFFECEGALTLRHGNRCTVEGNFFFGNRLDQTGGVRIIGEDHKIFNNYFSGLYGSSLKSALPIMNGVPNSPLNRYFQVKNALVAFNTFVDCRYTIILGAGKDSELTLSPENCTIANNVVLTTFKIITEEDAPINLTWEGNIMQGSSLGIPQPAGIALTDPKLSFAADSLWRSDSTSPVIGAAAGSYPFVIDDMDGQARGVNRDVGADEFSQEPIMRCPLKAADVMPEWMKNPFPVALRILTTGSGKVSLDPPGGVYEMGTQVNMTATPDSGWKFVQWEGDVNNTDNPLSISIAADMTVRAVFAEDVPTRYKLSVFVFSSGGYVTLDPPGGEYLEGTTVRLTAVPDSGWTFARWEGALTGTTNPDSIVMDSDKMVLGVFTQLTHVSELMNNPVDYRLDQNYPNPFNAKTNISFSIAKAGKTSLQIFDVRGREITTLMNHYLEPGFYNFSFDASRLVSGVYIFKITSRDFVSVKKMIVMK